jgi:hypothetical protein
MITILPKLEEKTLEITENIENEIFNPSPNSIGFSKLTVNTNINSIQEVENFENVELSVGTLYKYIGKTVDGYINGEYYIYR